MAGYAGARTRIGTPVPRRRQSLHEGGGAPATSRAEVLPRRGVRGATAVRSRRRQGQAGMVIVGIVVIFLLGLFSLSQTVRVSATDMDVDRLIAARQEFVASEQDLVADLSRLGSEPAIRKLALDAGLGQLIDPLVVPAR
jgi:hypothetical protein